MKSQGVYWLTCNKEPLHDIRSQLLADIGYDVTYFDSIDELEASLSTKRVSIVIIGDEGEAEQCVAAIEILSNLPVIQGARLILSQSTDNPQLCQLAAGNGFRDIIPLNLEPEKWLMRFQFSTSSKDDLEHVMAMDPQKESIPVEMFVPARLAWINGEQVWLESRARPKMSEPLSLIGSLAEEMGCRSIELSVNSHESRNLVYRFSEGMICDWIAQSEETEKIGSVIDELRVSNLGARAKVFLAIQSPALRNTILKYLNPEIFDVHTALQKKSLISEPKYFTPQLVFIEYRLCEGEAMSRFQEMVNHIPADSTVVVVGAKEEQLESFRNFSSGRRIRGLAQIPKNLPELIHSDYLVNISIESDKNIYIPYSHRFSYCELKFAAQVVAWKNDYVELLTSSRVANYGLIRISPEKESSSPLYGKVVNVRMSNQNENLVICQLSNPKLDASLFWRGNPKKKSQSS